MNWRTRRSNLYKLEAKVLLLTTILSWEWRWMSDSNEILIYDLPVGSGSHTKETCRAESIWETLHLCKTLIESLLIASHSLSDKLMFSLCWASNLYTSDNCRPNFCFYLCRTARNQKKVTNTDCIHFNKIQ
jgi:hypothetical protein